MRLNIFCENKKKLCLTIKEMIKKENVIHRHIWPERWGYIAPIYKEMNEELDKRKKKPLPSQIVRVDPADFSHMWPNQELRGFEPKDSLPPIRSSRMYGWKIGKSIVDKTDRWVQPRSRYNMYKDLGWKEDCIWTLVVGLCICVFVQPLNAEPHVCATYRNAFPTCSCLTAEISNEGIIDCSGLALTSVPVPTVAIPDVIFEMRFNNNNITSLRNNSFTGLKIRKLDLRDNNVATVEMGSFQGLQNYLFYLYIDGNGISAPPSEALRSLLNLLELTLRNYGSTALIASSGLFLPFRKLQKLTLENWKLTYIESGALLGPENLFSFILNKQNLVALPLDLLHLEDNLITLRQLTVTNTKIQDISSYAFQKLVHLQVLDLSQNHIDTLEEFCFDGLANSLQNLNLSGNILSSSTGKMTGLTSLPKLTELDLSTNYQISNIPDLSQLKLTQHLKLYLANNQIQNLGGETLNSLGSSLHTLDISNNRINFIDPKAFNNAPSLAILNLSNQPLPINVWSVIINLNKLEVLNLSNTKLNNIPNYTFENMTNLRELDLSSAKYAANANNFQTITPEALVGPYKSLKGLYLSGSGLTTLSPCLFNEYTSFPITMSLGGTHLTCDCDIYWLWLKIKNKNITFLTGEEPKCSSNGKRLSDQQQSEFCSNPPSTRCTDHYVYPRPNITLLVGVRNITASWKLSTLTSNIRLLSFIVLLEDSNSQIVLELNLTPSTYLYIFSNLLPGSQYTVCVIAVYTDEVKMQCNPTKTLRQ
ncbi:hypothetical protein Btru_012166 [Bulinus truncatus]|nr:hypothetical protein Btru_012166 [Bulinus truncatus]